MFGQLGQQLQAGNLSGAQQACSTVQLGFQQFALNNSSSSTVAPIRRIGGQLPCFCLGTLAEHSTVCHPESPALFERGLELFSTARPFLAQRFLVVFLLFYSRSKDRPLRSMILVANSTFLQR